MEFSEALAKELGVKVKLQTTPWAGILAALESKRLDAVVNQVTISEERKKNMTSPRRIPFPGFRRWY